jgi:hypothetical protein
VAEGIVPARPLLSSEEQSRGGASETDESAFEILKSNQQGKVRIEARQ